MSGLPRHVWPAAAIIATCALAPLAGACAGSRSSRGGASLNVGAASGSPSVVAFSACMRSRGVPNYPDPGRSGQPAGDAPKVDNRQLGVSNSQFRAAERACQRLLPFDDEVLSADSLRQCELTGDCPPALVQPALTQLRRFARCMRSRGAANWPDPSTDARGAPGFAISVSKDGFDPDSPQIETRVGECGHVMHPAIGVPRAVSP